jgi:hypothetical protein
MFGKAIRVSFSKHQFVQMPKDGTSVNKNNYLFPENLIYFVIGYGFNKRFHKFTIASF